MWARLGSLGVHRGWPPATEGGVACSTRSRTGSGSETSAKTSAMADDGTPAACLLRGANSNTMDEQVVGVDGGSSMATTMNGVCLRAIRGNV